LNVRDREEDLFDKGPELPFCDGKLQREATPTDNRREVSKRILEGWDVL